MPRWLETVLLAAGLLVGLAFLAEPVLVLYRRRERRAARLSTATAGAGQGPALGKGPGCGQGSGPGQWPGPGRPGAGKARVVLADFDRVVVTHSACDDTVYVLRPPGEDPAAILRAARLVLPEGPNEELADQLGVPAGLPME